MLFSQAAFATTRTAVVVTAGTKVETSPYQDAGSPPVGVAFSVGVAPSMSITSGTSAVTLAGSADFDQYVANYGNDISGSLTLSGTSRVSAKTSVSGSVGFSSSLRSYRYGLQSLPDPAIEPEFIPPIDGLLNDPSLLGTRSRSNNLNASVGLSHTLSARDSFNISGGYSRGWSNSAASRDFQNYSGRIGYGRRLSAATVINVGFSAARSNYIGQNFGQSTILSPSLGVTTRLGKRWNLSASAGASITHMQLAPGVTLNSTSASGQLSLCSRDERGGICFSAARAVQPTYLGDTRARNQFSASYSRRLNQKDSFTLSSVYSMTGSSALGVRGGANDMIGADARFSHRFQRRFDGFVGAGFDKVLRSAVPRKTNFTANIGVRYAFGDSQ